MRLFLRIPNFFFMFTEALINKTMNTLNAGIRKIFNFYVRSVFMLELPYYRGC